MTIDVERGVLVELTSAGAVEKHSRVVNVHPSAVGFQLYALFDQDGTLDVDYVEFGSDPLNPSTGEVHTESTTANTAVVVVFDFNPGAFRVRFTPALGNASGRVEYTYFGHQRP